jgi:crotonobetainyl-CoA:carnitine CoA-transferase CaiB-like acyl-CoA transferase
VLSRDLLVEVDHPKAGKIKQIGTVIKYSETPCELQSPPPILGQYTQEILKEVVGYDEEKIKELKESGSI